MSYYWCLLAIVLQLWNCQITESNCERALEELEMDSDDVLDQVVADLFSNRSTNSFAPEDKEFNYTCACLAQGTSEGLYRTASITVEHYCNPNNTVGQSRRHFQLLCYDDTWQINNGLMCCPYFAALGGNCTGDIDCDDNYNIDNASSDANYICSKDRIHVHTHY